MRQLAISALGVLVAMSAGVAQARTPSVWVQCDGLPKPEGSATTAARILAVAAGAGFGIGLLALPESSTGRPEAGGTQGVEACTAALAEPVLKNFPMRRVSVLRARAKHHLASDDFDAALADLEAANEFGAGLPAAPAFDRSLGVSAKLFEAALRARRGEEQEALRLAAEAADARPYALAIQDLAHQFFAAQPAISEDEARILARKARLDPSRAVRSAPRMDATIDADGAADAWEEVLASGGRTPIVFADGPRLPMADIGPDPLILAQAALAFARAGRLDRAEALYAQLIAAMSPSGPDASEVVDAQAARTRSRAELNEAERTRLRDEIAGLLRAQASPYVPVIEAMIAWRKGDAARAVSLVQAALLQLPSKRAVADLLAEMAAHPAAAGQLPAAVVSPVLEKVWPSMQARWRQRDMDQFLDTLPPLDPVTGRQRYAADGAPGFRNGIGYRDWPTETGVRVTVGGGSSATLQEKALLRAAELAIAAGAKDMQITARNRLSSFQATTIVDQEALEVSFDTGDPHALDPKDVHATLAPIYIDLPRQIAEGERQSR